MSPLKKTGTLETGILYTAFARLNVPTYRVSIWENPGFLTSFTPEQLR